MAVHNILSPKDLCDTIRSLSDESLFEITGVTKPVLWPSIRAAMMTFAWDCGTYIPGEEKEFFDDFLLITDMEAIQIKTVMGVADVQRYSDFFSKLKATNAIHHKASLVSTTQVFSLHDAYVGAWFTCEDEHGDPFWVFITDDWQHSFHTNMAAVCECAQLAAGSPWFGFSAYGNVGHWPLVHAGIRHFNRD